MANRSTLRGGPWEAQETGGSSRPDSSSSVAPLTCLFPRRRPCRPSTSAAVVEAESRYRRGAEPRNGETDDEGGAGEEPRQRERGDRAGKGGVGGEGTESATARLTTREDATTCESEW